MQYLRGKMMAVTSAVRRDMEGRQRIAEMQQPNTESVVRQDHVVSDLQKKKIVEMEENSEVKRIKINQTESGLHTEKIVNEEWKKISLGIEQQARAVHLQVPAVTNKKVGEFGGELTRTIINKPLLESKQTAFGTVSNSRSVTEPQPKNITLSDSASRAKPDQGSAKKRDKHRRWDDSKESGKSRKYEDDKRSHQRHSPSYRSTRTPPRSYQRSPLSSQYGRNVFSLRDDKCRKDSPAGKGTVGKLSSSLQSNDVVIIDDEVSKQSPAAKAAEKSPVVKASSSSLPVSSTTSTATTAASSVPSFKFGWKSKVAKPTLPKPGVQSGPLPGYKGPDKGMIAVCVLQIPHSRSKRPLWHKEFNKQPNNVSHRNTSIKCVTF